MNYKRILMLFTLTAFMVSAFAVEGQCKAEAFVYGGACSTYVKVHCKCVSKKTEKESEFKLCPTSCHSEEYVSCAAGAAWARAKANAWCNTSGSHGTRTSAESFAVAGCRASADKDALQPDTFYAHTDSTTVHLDSVSPGLAQLSLDGRMIATKSANAELTVVVFQNNNVNDVVFTGDVFLDGNTGQVDFAGFSPGNFTVTPYPPDSTTVEFNFIHGNFAYVDSFNVLGLWTKANAAALGQPAVPALTQYGMLVLLVLLILSAVYVIRRRRQGVVAR